jgi:hypothetical protein
VYTELLPHYSHLGRPSIDPVLMIRMLSVGYVFEAARLRGNGGQSGLSLVLQAQRRGQDPGSFGVLACRPSTSQSQRNKPASSATHSSQERT